MPIKPLSEKRKAYIVKALIITIGIIAVFPDEKIACLVIPLMWVIVFLI